MVHVRIEKLVAGGDGLGRLADGRVVFVPDVVPGELVDAVVTTSKKDFVRARGVAVIEASPDRVQPRCVHLAEGCGGCDWQHIDPAAQLRIKADIVSEALRRTARLDGVDVVVGGAVDPWAYRSTMRVVATDNGRAGLRQRGSHSTVPIPHCHVAVAALGAVLRDVSLPAGDERSLRVSVGGRSADGLITERVGDRELIVSDDAFFQSGPQAAELLVECVSRLVGPERPRRLLDAYGGVGLFAALIPADHVTMVESNPVACADARRNLAAAQSVDVVCSTVEGWPNSDAFDVVIADPARAGLGRDGVERLMTARPERLILVSCDPVAMARDARLLTDAGYRLDHCEVLDLFPQTHHVEVVSRFVPGG